jgi:KDO2-lipid IV(A) lauroyltransferase
MDGMADAEQNPDLFGSVEELTQWYNDVLAAQIRRQPEQYWWLHDRWREVKTGKRRKKAAAAAKEIQRPAA